MVRVPITLWRRRRRGTATPAAAPACLLSVRRRLATSRCARAPPPTANLQRTYDQWRHFRVWPRGVQARKLLEMSALRGKLSVINCSEILLFSKNIMIDYFLVTTIYRKTVKEDVLFLRYHICNFTAKAAAVPGLLCSNEVLSLMVRSSSLFSIWLWIKLIRHSMSSKVMTVMLIINYCATVRVKNSGYLLPSKPSYLCIFQLSFGLNFKTPSFAEDCFSSAFFDQKQMSC